MTHRLGLAVLVCVATLALTVSPSAAQVNSMTVTDKSGTARTNYPLQFARPFVQGQIANYPQVLVNGSPVTTQADVKQRWPDNSVKHAVLSLLVPSIAANGSVTLTFQNQASGNNTPLTKTQMLNAAYNFDAVTQIVSGGVTRTASARTMLSNDAFTYWTQGPIATTVILADHSTARVYDMGFDSLRSIRPIFEATFWPTINKVSVRFIGENSCTEALEDVGYDLTLKTGNTGQQTVYTKAGYVHKAATRWTKVFWINGAPDARINVDNNLAYLVQTYFVPRYDTSLTVPESRIAGDYTSWQSAAKDIQDNGWWARYMPMTGGRADIGHLPAWMTQWLYTGDYRSREIAFTQGDLAGNWQMHVREGNSSKKYDRAQTISALGKPVSICARPGLWIFDTRDSSDPDWIIPNRGATIPTPGGDWTYDNAHQPDPFSIQYVLTGDHWYLEQMQMWGTFAAMIITDYQRGPAGSDYAGIVDQVRGNAWSFRNRVNPAFFSPDNTPEKDYFTMLVNDALAHWEGWHGVNGTFAGTTLYLWAQSRVGQPYGLSTVSPLHYFDWQNDGTYPAYPQSTAPWMNYFLMIELGIAREKGFAADATASWFSQMLTGQFLDPGYYVYQVGDYWHPVKRQDGTWIATWAESEQALVATGVYTDSAALTNFTSSADDTDHGYPVIASAAAALNADYPNAGTAWSFLKANVRDPHIAAFASNPKWAILPRSYVPPQDATPPAAIADLAASNPTANSVTLTWTAPSDPNSLCTAYDIRYSTSTINAANWASATQVTSEPAPAAPGTSQNMVVSGLTGATTYYFAMKTSDAVPNWSALSNVASATTIATNLALNRPVTASSEFDSSFLAAYAVDGNAGTRWSSLYSDPQWIYVDLGQTYSVNRVKLNWNAYGKVYQIQLSSNAVDWTTVYNETNGNGGIDDLNFTLANGRYVRMYGTERGMGYGYSLYEFEVYGSLSDVTAPAAVTNLATGSPTASSITLTWTAPGDDGSTGTAASYDIRYSTSTITAGNWASATQVSGEPTPAAAGTNQNMTVSGLNPSTTYYFAIKTADEVPNWSALSNVPSGTTNAASSNLALGRPATASSIWDSSFLASYAVDGNVDTRWSSIGGVDPQWIYVDLGQTYAVNRVKLNWQTAYGRDYQIQVSNDASNWTTAHSVTNGDGGIDDLSFTAGNGRYVRMYGTARGTGYGYSLYEFEVYGSLGDVTAPAAVSNLATSSPTTSSLTLNWAAPGDDGSTGTAASYDIRYSTSTINAGNWASATQVTGEPTPAAAGTSQNMTVSGLNPSTTYYFAMKTVDEVPNTSGLSNVASGTTSANTTNLALNRPATASSIWDSSFLASYAVDGNVDTRWSSIGGVDPQWIYVDLGATYSISRVKLSWQAAYGRDYTIQVSSDASNWTTVYTVTGGDGGVDDWTFTPTSARYVRMYGTARGTGYGYSIIEFEVY